MYDSYNYPPGADTPSAPWNQKEPVEVEVDVCASNTLHRDATISVTDYKLVTEVEVDDGHTYTFRNPDFSDTNFIDEFKNQCYSVKEILDEFVKTIKELEYNGYSKRILRRLKNLSKEASQWKEDEFEVVKD